jgi:hypothetical protein
MGANGMSKADPAAVEASSPPDAATAPDGQATDAVEPVWALAANVVAERRYGPDGAELRPGTKIFRGGSKVYVIGGYGGMGYDDVCVVGRGRHRPHYVTAIMPLRHLENFRAVLIRSPAVLDRIKEERSSERGYLPTHWVTSGWRRWVTSGWRRSAETAVTCEIAESLAERFEALADSKRKTRWKK